ncbi:hypothetical protein BGZ73_004116 [Actinomortierella ambigua]|nr:hypothetical protein BGZ73_004116 [Actinomortierella ambigua]
MKPDRHKQAASRRYQAKVKARGGSAAAASSATGAGHGHSGPHHARTTRREPHARQEGSDHDNEDDEDEDETGYTTRKSYARRKLVSNLDRYVEETEEVNEAEELEQGIDRQTMEFEELLMDSDQKHSFNEAAYFRFKSEKLAEDLETSASTGSGLASVDDNQHAQKWMQIRLDDLETSLMRLSFSERLYLSATDQAFYGYDHLDDNSGVVDHAGQQASGGKVSFKAGTPIVPKLVRGEAAADILIQSSGNKGDSTTKKTAAGGAASSTKPTTLAQQASAPVPGIKQLSNVETRRQQAKASRDQDLDELLDQSKRTVVSIRDLPRAQPLAQSSPKPLSGSLPGSSSTGASKSQSSSTLPTPSTVRKVALPVPGKPQGATSPSPSLPRPMSKPATLPKIPASSKSAANLDDEWLDSVLE